MCESEDPNANEAESKKRVKLLQTRNTQPIYYSLPVKVPTWLGAPIRQLPKSTTIFFYLLHLFLVRFFSFFRRHGTALGWLSCPESRGSNSEEMLDLPRCKSPECHLGSGLNRYTGIVPNTSQAHSLIRYLTMEFPGVSERSRPLRVHLIIGKMTWRLIREVPCLILVDK